MAQEARRKEERMIERIIIIYVGFFLDLLFGDPHWLYHPVRAIGQIITWTEKLLQKLLKYRSGRETDIGKKRVAGTLLVLVVLLFSIGVPAAVLAAAGSIHPYLKTGISCFWCYQLLAMRSLKTESMKVFAALKTGDIEQARTAVSMIVGRDTKSLDEAGITRAAVETVAENTSDGVIAPLCYMLLFGVLGGFFYKAINTMDSMIGYKNEKYCYFGTAAARLDDICSFLPSRIAAVYMIGAAFLLGFDGKNALYIYRRDRHMHASPNSAQTEAVCAGALSIQLAGDAYYFGKLYHKPTIGDDKRRIEPEDIKRANRLLYGTSVIVLCVGVVVLAVVAMLV